MRKMTILSLIMIVLVLTQGSVTQAHLEEPGTPIHVELTWTGSGTTVNHNDGADQLTDLLLKYTIIHVNHGSSTSSVSHDYECNKVTNLFGPAHPACGTLIFGAIFGPAPVPAPVLLYQHDECTPLNALSIHIRAWEDDDFGDELFGTASHTFSSTVGPEAPILTTAGGPPADGELEIRLNLTVTPIEGECPPHR